MRVEKNGWVTLGSVVTLKEKKYKSGKTAMALVVDKNTTVIIKQKAFGKDGEYIIERELKGGSYLNITPVDEHAERLYSKKPEQLQKQLDFYNQNQFLKYHVGAGPEKPAAEYIQEPEELSEMDGEEL